MANKSSKWETVGEIGVDAGLCWLGDPCYILHKDDGKAPKDLGTSWMDFCKRLEQKEDAHPTKRAAQFNYDMGHAGLGVVVSTGYGDGCYPVQIKRNAEGRVAEVRIKFI
jgi:hypothetical protein